MPIRPTHRASVLLHASWAIPVRRPTASSGRGATVHRAAAATADDRSAIANVVVLEQPMLDMDQAICEVDDLFPRGVPFSARECGPTSDLSRYRLALVGHPPLMFRPPSTARDWPSTSLDVRWVSNSDELADAERVLVDGYPMPELQPFTARSPVHASVAGHVDANRRGVRRRRSACHGGGALGSRRHPRRVCRCDAQGAGKGACAAVTAAATHGVPAAVGVLLATDDGQPVYERLGYLRLERWTLWAARHLTNLASPASLVQRRACPSRD